jgi:DNA (cytosine-5)-methyltransferase 1
MPGVISLFCGPGGFDQGFTQAGFETILAYDKDQVAVDTHRKNHPTANALKADLAAIEVKSIVQEWQRRSDDPPRGLIGGSPCQSFSVSNVHQKPHDKRHLLPLHFARILAGLHAEFDLDFFAFENVPGYASKKHSRRFQIFKGRLARIGFRIFEGVINAQDFGVPQIRSRIFVVGVNERKYTKEILPTFDFPPKSRARRRDVSDVLRGLPKPVYFDRRDATPLIPFHRNHWCMSPRAARFYDGSLKPGHAQGRSFRVLAWNKPSYTVAYGNREVHVHPNRRRRLSVFEAMLLQGFPKSYVLTGTLSDQIRLISEAVSPPVARALGRTLRAQLDLE